MSTAEPSFRVDEEPAESLLEFLSAALVAFNDGQAMHEDYRPLAVSARSEGEVIGGVAGYTHWGWLYPSALWVRPDWRRRGIGGGLVTFMERAATKRGAHAAHVNTFDFQALDFYKRLGYSVFGQLPNYPMGHDLYYLTKRLTS